MALGSTVSVIIPTYNRIDALRQTLSALEAVQYPSDRWEVVIVDDGSSDGTEEMVQDSIRRSHIHIRFFRQANGGPASARNRGAFEACGELLLFIDNDIVVPCDFIELHVAAHVNNPGSWVMGRVVQPPEFSSTPFGRYRNELCEGFHREKGDTLVEIDSISTQNLSLSADEFRRLGGFDEAFTIASSEDWELGQRAMKIGIRLFYQPRIVATHNDWAGTLESYCERQWLYSVSDVLLSRKYAERNSRPARPGERPGRLAERPTVPHRQETPQVCFGNSVRPDLSPGVAPARRARFFPYSSMNYLAYRLVLGEAIFRGVREGFRRYPEASP